MSDKDFEAGRKMESLERQIKTIASMIRFARNPETMRAEVGDILGDVLGQYLPLAVKYKGDIRGAAAIYNRAMGIEGREYFSPQCGF